MTDLALFWDGDLGCADVMLDGADLATDTGLTSAIVVSLFTDRRASADDVLPDAGADRRGWWGDNLAEGEGDQIGSRLWLLGREKQTPAVAAQARDYAMEALAWLTEDGIASAVEVETAWAATGVLGIGVIVTRPGGPTRQRYDFVWKGL